MNFTTLADFVVRVTAFKMHSCILNAFNTKIDVMDVATDVSQCEIVFSHLGGC